MLEQIMAVSILASRADQQEWIYRAKRLALRTRCWNHMSFRRFLPQPSSVWSNGLNAHRLLKCIRCIPAAHLLVSVSWDEPMSRTVRHLYLANQSLASGEQSGDWLQKSTPDLNWSINVNAPSAGSRWWNCCSLHDLQKSKVKAKEPNVFKQEQIVLL